MLVKSGEPLVLHSISITTPQLSLPVPVTSLYYSPHCHSATHAQDTIIATSMVMLPQLYHLPVGNLNDEVMFVLKFFKRSYEKHF